MEFVIARENDYKKEVKTHYESILNCRLCSIIESTSPIKNTLESIKEYDIHKKKDVENFLTWVTIGKSFSSNYKGQDYKFVSILSNGEEAFKINFSQFKYGMSVNKETSLLDNYDSKNAEFVCTIDNNKIDPSTFFSKNYGKKMLLLYSFNATTSFEQNKICYNFAFEKLSVQDIRKNALLGLRFILSLTLNYPSYNIPATTICRMDEETGKIIGGYIHYAYHKIVYKFAENIFNNEYRNLFEEKLKFIEEEITKMI